MEDKLLSGVPFPYLLQESEFYQHRFYVNEDVLIPRPETEQLVDLVVRSGRRFTRGLDVGTGSGVILFSLLKAGAAERGTGVDISEAAISVAKINRRRLRLQSMATLLKSDRLRSVEGQFDLIVSNPPYIKRGAHRRLVQRSVDQHEPALALYLRDEDYERWFQELFGDVFSRLLPSGLFLMEGHELEIGEQAKVLAGLGFRNVEVLKDFGGLDRFLRAQKPAP